MASLTEIATSLDVGPMVLAPPIAAAIYGLLVWDARRGESGGATDAQIGVKTVLATLLLVGAFHLGRGVRGLLHLLLTFERVAPRSKIVFPELMVGGAVVIATAWVLFPRTNVEQFSRVRRLIAGTIALFGGIAFVEALLSLATTVLSWPSWNAVAATFAAAITTAGSLAAGAYFLALYSGLDVPPLQALRARQLPPSPR